MIVRLILPGCFVERIANIDIRYSLMCENDYPLVCNKLS